jgi:heme ABC exporter ATP-binding subunit CcmA
MVAATGLRKRFGASLVLDDLSLAVGPGECVALLGPNGSGKSTLLRILATVLRPTAGSLFIGGVDALARPESARPLIGMLGHGSYVYDDLTALENLRFWAVLSGQDASAPRLGAALEAVNLDGVAGERARTFSAGMKRRLGLARVLLGRPPLLLLDEPFTGLDRQGRKWAQDVLQELRDRGAAILLATHSLGTGLELASRVAILSGGRLAVDCPAEQLSGDDLRDLYDRLTDGAEGAP